MKCSVTVCILAPRRKRSSERTIEGAQRKCSGRYLRAKAAKKNSLVGSSTGLALVFHSFSTTGVDQRRLTRAIAKKYSDAFGS
jgi:hypothetical protein